jgi:membrane protease subunit HflK
VLAEYQKAPQVTRDRLYIDTMQQVLNNVTKVMVDSHNNSNLLYLPLDKLLQQAGATSASGGAAPSSSSGLQDSTPAPSAGDARSRDNARSRDREGR